MSIQSSVRRNSAPIGMAALPTSSHLLIIRDPDLGKKLEEDPNHAWCVEVSGRGSRKRWFIPVTRAHLFAETLGKYSWEDDQDIDTDWLQILVDESSWARENRPKPRTGIAWMAGNHLVIQCGFVFTLSRYIESLPSNSVTYHHDIKGWVIADLDLNETEALRDKLQKYDIMLSPELESRLDGSERWREILAEAVKQAKADGYPVPSMFITDRCLKTHQEQAVLAMAHRRANLLADQVGLGKGSEFIGAWLSIVQKMIEDGEDAPWPILIVTTSSLKEDIAGEILKWKQDAKIEVLYGRNSDPISEEAEFIVTNIDLLSGRKEDIMEAGIRGFVCDEAHMLKNPDALRTQAAQEITDWMREQEDDPYITLASGTPFLNRPEELWSLLCILGRETLFSDYAEEKLGGRLFKFHTRNGWKHLNVSDRNLFERYFCDGQYDKYKKWYADGATHTLELNQLLLKTCMIRRKKSDVMHPMPKLDEFLVPIDMSAQYAQDYDNAYDDFYQYMKELATAEAEELDISINEAIKIVLRKLAANKHIMQLTHLRQIVAKGKIEGTKKWIRDFMDGTLTYSDKEGKSITVGDDPTRKKLIVFAYHREVQQMLINDPELQEYGLVHIRSGEDPEEHKRMFQEDDRYRLMICYSGAREGHTLTAAKDVFISEVPFVPSWVIQMAGRCWARISELYDPHEATVWFGVTPGTIDSNLINKVRLKKRSFSAVIDGEGMEKLEDEDNSDEAADALMSMLIGGKKSVSIAA